MSGRNKLIGCFDALSTNLFTVALQLRFMSRNDPINNANRAFLPGKEEQNLLRHQGGQGHLIALLSLDRRRETLVPFVTISSGDVKSLYTS